MYLLPVQAPRVTGSMNRHLVALGLVPVLLSSACAKVTGYSNLQAQIRDASQVALIADVPDPSKPTPAPGTKGLHYLKSVAVLPAGREQQSVTLEDGPYKVELRRSGGAISYQTNVDTSGALLSRSEIVPLDLDLPAIEALQPSTPLEWEETIRLDITDIQTTTQGTSMTKNFMPVKLSTTWANVHQVTGRQIKSAPVAKIAIGAAIVSYIVGAGLIAIQLKTWQDNGSKDEGQKKPVSGAMVGAGSGLIVLGIPLLIFGIKDLRTHKVSVYGEAKGERVKP